MNHNILKLKDVIQFKFTTRRIWPVSRTIYNHGLMSQGS